MRAALKPFGYYEPTVRSKLDDLQCGNWRVTIDIEPGQPVVMESVTIAVHGPGCGRPAVRAASGGKPAAAPRRPPEPRRLREDQGRPAAHRRDLRLSGRAPAAQRAAGGCRRTHSQARCSSSKPASATASAPTTIEQDAIDERAACAVSSATARTSPSISRRCCARSSRSMTASTSPTWKCCPARRTSTTHVVPISLRADANRRHRYSFGVGYGTDTQERGRITWEDRRVNRAGIASASSSRPPRSRKA